MLKIVSALSNETYSFFINLMKVADDKDFYVDGNWSNVNNSNIFSTSNFSNLYMDKYSCYAKCKWAYNYRCNYIIIDGNTCYFASNTHLSGLMNNSDKFSENAILVKSNGKDQLFFIFNFAFLQSNQILFINFIFQSLFLILICVLSN